VLSGVDTGFERQPQERRRRLNERRGRTFVRDAATGTFEKLAQRLASEEAQMRAIVETRPRIRKRAGKRAQPIVPNGVVRDRDEPGSDSCSRMLVQAPEQGERIGDVLDHVGKQHHVEAAIVFGLEPAFERPLEYFVRRCPGETSGFGVRLDSRDRRFGCEPSDLARVRSGARTHVENDWRRSLGENVSLEELDERAVRSFHVRVAPRR